MRKFRLAIFYLLFVLFSSQILLASAAFAGIAGKDPACVGNCGREMSSRLASCRPNIACFNECNNISALRTNMILECQNRCADEIQICEDLAKAYNNDCINQCGPNSSTD